MRSKCAAQSRHRYSCNGMRSSKSGWPIDQRSDILRTERNSVKLLRCVKLRKSGRTNSSRIASESRRASTRAREDKVKRLAVCAVVSILVFGCSSSKSSDPNLDAWEREVKIITPAQIGDRQYEEIGGLLEEREQIRASYGSEEQAVDAAKRRLRRRAAELDADAVVIIECGRHIRPAEPVEQPSLPGNFPEIICHGVAIRWLD